MCPLALTLVILSTGGLWLLHWAVCRVTAKTCPACESRMRTELQEEWETELWKCHRCGLVWDEPFAGPR